MSQTHSRRNFLRGKFSAAPGTVRPPWAVDEGDFAERCTRCGDCARACPSKIIVQGDGGYPVIDFGKGECTFCAACVSACPSAALNRAADAPPWQLHATIGEACLAHKQVECRVCGEMCEAGAIRFRPLLGGVSTPDLDPDVCTGCGACFAPCPSGAIRLA